MSGTALPETGDSNVMNPVLALPNALNSVVEQFAFLRIPSKQSAKQLSGSAEELIGNIREILNHLILGVIEKRTIQEFMAAREDAFPKYARAIRAISDLVSIVVPSQVIERLTSESFCEVEADFRELGLESFGAALRDQAVFTVWTFRKINSLYQKIPSGQVPQDLSQKDRDIAEQFSTCALWARFHLDCLVTAMEFHKPISPDARDVITDGLRGAVNAYAWMKQRLDLRHPSVEPAIGVPEWDDEDEELTNSSMADLIESVQ